MKIDIDGNFDEIQRIIKDIPHKIVIPSLVTAINRAARDGKSSARKALAKSTGVKQRSIKSRVSGASGRARANRKRTNAMVFVRTEKGVKFSAALNKGAIKKVKTRKSFVATMPSGHKSVYERTGQRKVVPKQGVYHNRIVKRGPNRGHRMRREPIDELKIPLHPVGTRAAKNAFIKRSKETLLNELTRQINRKLNK